MEIKFKIDNCSQCKHCGHSGGFTPGGSKPVCEHPKIIKYVGDDKKDPYDWKYRVIPYKVDFIQLGSSQIKTKDPKKIPSWCPLKHGEKY